MHLSPGRWLNSYPVPSGCGGGSPSDCLGDGDRFLLAPGSPCGNGGLALVRTHRAVEALNKSASYREAAAAKLMLVGIAVCKARKACCGVSLPVHREDERDLIDRAWETHPERARKLEGSEGCGAAGLDLIIEDQKPGQPVQGYELSSTFRISGCEA